MKKLEGKSSINLYPGCQALPRLQPEVRHQQRGRVRRRDQESRVRGHRRGRQRRMLDREAEVQDEAHRGVRS